MKDVGLLLPLPHGGSLVVWVVSDAWNGYGLLKGVAQMGRVITHARSLEVQR